MCTTLHLLRKYKYIWTDGCAINNSPSLCRSRQALRVREHNVFGPYVDGLSRLAVASYKVLVKYFMSNV